MKNIAKKISLALVLFSVLILCASCDNSEKFFTEYSAFVEEVERAASKNEGYRYANFELKSAEFEDRVDALKKSPRWSKRDETLYSQLSGRLGLAMTKLAVTKTADSVINAIKGIGEALGN